MGNGRGLGALIDLNSWRLGEFVSRNPEYDTNFTNPHELAVIHSSEP